jgi:hypothetical protein
MSARVIKAFISFILLTLIFLVTPLNSYAQNYYPNQASPSAYTQLPQNLTPQSPHYVNLMILNLIHGFGCIVTGSSITGEGCVDFALTKDLQGHLSAVPVLSDVNTSGGLLGLTGTMLIGMYSNPPLLVGDYLAHAGAELGIIPEAKAQVGGSGGGVLSPILALWQLSRNIAYLFMIIIFMVVGIMVMFRRKLNPQTVLTVQAALPGLVIGLILITFSYFLAALITDLAFIGTDLVGFYFQLAQNPTSGPQQLSQSLADKSVLNIFSPFVGAIPFLEIQAGLDIIWDGIRGTSGDTINPFNSQSFSAEYFIRGFAGVASYQVGAFVGPIIGYIVGYGLCLVGVGVPVVGLGMPFLAPAAIGSTACGIVGQATGAFVAPGIAGAVGFFNPPLVAAIAIYFIATVIILYAMGKLLLRLINCYLAIIFYTITGPFHLLVAALPGRQGVAIDWMRNILCNILAFPAVAAVIYFAGFLLANPTSHLPGIDSQLNVFGQGAALPLFGGLNLSFLRVLLAFGALIAVPAVPDIICRSIGKPAAGADLLGREIQGNIKGGQEYGEDYNKRLRFMAQDIESRREKWYQNPTEKRGFSERIRSFSELDGERNDALIKRMEKIMPGTAPRAPGTAFPGRPRGDQETGATGDQHPGTGRFINGDPFGA